MTLTCRRTPKARLMPLMTSTGLKAQVDDLSKQNHDLNNLKARLTQENFDLQRQVQELDSSNAALSKAKGQLQHALDDTKSRLDEESRVSRFILL